MIDGNPFAVPSTLPHQLPPFAAIRPEHYRPAFEAGMAAQRVEVEAITTGPAPTFANTLVPLERSGALLRRVGAVFWNLSSAASTPELAALEQDLAPRLAAHRDAIHLDRRLFERIDTLYRARADLDLDGEQLRLLERYHTDFVRAGAGLDPARAQRLREINAEISTLTTTFRAALRADTNDLAVHVGTEAELAGLPADAIAAAREAARGAGRPGYLLTLVLPTQQPALELLADRAVRQGLFRAAVSRGARGNEHDTRVTLTRLVALRAERAGLLGYPDHAAYVIADQTASSTEAVLELLGTLAGRAVANARAEAAELEAALVADGHPPPLQPWDWAYYAQRLRQQTYQLDAAALRPWFELGTVLREGVFRAAQILYGLGFELRADLPGYAEDVEVYQVTDEDGAPRGLVLTDWYTRPGKSGGAWMSTFVDQSHLLGQQPVTVINLNVPRPPRGEPTLLTLDEVTTVFHEFGHVLHALLSDVHFPRLSGTSVPRDFVEFPSQVNEMWMYWPELLSRYAVHHVTGEPLPAGLIEALLAARSYGQGFATTEYLAAALLDLHWHRRPAGADPIAPADVERFERQALAEHGLDLPLVPPRYRSSYFQHVFAGGYSAGYYGYLWSEVLDADTVQWFTDGGLNRDTGRRFADELLSRGGARDPMAAFAAVLGRPPRTEPLLARRGLLAQPG